MAQDVSLPTRMASPTLPSARIALMLLVLINLFNYIDRQVLAAVEPEIRRELLGGYPEKDAKFYMGLLATAFLVSYMALAPVFGYLADRYSRWALVGFGVVFWSLATGASGLPWNSWGVAAGAAFVFLLVTRCFVGVGEAAYGPVAPAMIADLFPLRKRGMVLAFFYLALPVGGALGYALGEAVISGHVGNAVSGLGSMLGRDWDELSKHLSSWHWAFFLVVPPGMLLGVWCFLMRDPPKGRTDGVAPVQKKLSLKEILGVLRIPSYALNTIGMTFMSFAIGGLAYWMSDYLEKRHVEPLWGVPPRTTFGIITALAGLVSTLSGGILGDLLRTRFSGSYFLVSGVAMLVGMPMVLGMVYMPFPGAWICVFLAVFCLFFNAGPTNTILANVIHPSIRGSAYALNILIIHLFGDAISPPLIGWISGGEENLHRGFILVAVVMGLGGTAWLLGARYLEEDTRLAPTRL